MKNEFRFCYYLYDKAEINSEEQKKQFDNMFKNAKYFEEWKIVLNLIDRDDERREHALCEVFRTANSYDECRQVCYLLDEVLSLMKIEFGDKMYRLARNEEERAYVNTKIRS